MPRRRVAETSPIDHKARRQQRRLEKSQEREARMHDLAARVQGAMPQPAKRLGAGYVEHALRADKIEAAPLNFLRGWTFEDCWVVLDEAQNTTIGEMKLFLTRIGERCRIIVNGDHTGQCDLPAGVSSGLMDGVEKARGLPEVGIAALNEVVRSGLTQRLVERYAAPKAPAHTLRHRMPMTDDEMVALLRQESRAGTFFAPPCNGLHHPQ